MTEQAIRDRFGDKLPKNYKFTPNTVILVGEGDMPILREDGEGNVVGFDQEQLFGKEIATGWQWPDFRDDIKKKGPGN